MSQLAVEKWLGVGGDSENEERVLIGFVSAFSVIWRQTQSEGIDWLCVCVLSDLETDTQRGY